MTEDRSDADAAAIIVRGRPRTLLEFSRSAAPQLEWLHEKSMGPGNDSRTHVGGMVAWRILRGAVTVATEGGRWRATAGSWVFLLPGSRRQAFAPGTRILSLSYRSGWPCHVPWYAGPAAIVLTSSPLDAAGEALLAGARRELGIADLGDRFAWRCSPMAWLRIDADFRRWLACAMDAILRIAPPMPEPGHDDARVQRALALLAHAPGQTLPAALARAVGLSRRRLEQLFRQVLGDGIGGVRDRLRLYAAQDLLADGSVPLKQAARRLGFPSGSAFSAWFRRHAGRSPSRFRSGRPGAPGSG